MMASERQMAANRANAKSSSGPKSRHGKARSRENAFRHGLSIGSRNIPGFQKDVMLVARALSPEGQEISYAALVAAEAEVDLLRIRKCRASLIDAFRDRDEALIENLVQVIGTFDRYERRAYAKRNKALRVIEG
jgi:hypothetical protein